MVEKAKAAPEPTRRMAVARAAAQVAVAASKRTGRPADPRVKVLAESTPARSRHEGAPGCRSYTEGHHPD